MTIEFHKDCVDRLCEALEEALTAISVESGNSINVSTWGGLDDMDPIVPDRGGIRDKLESIIGDDPVATFLKTQLLADVREAAPYNSGAPPTPLSQVSGFSDLSAVARTMIERLTSLPWSYRLCAKTSIPAGSLALVPGRSVSFYSGMRLEVADEQFQDANPFEKPEVLLGEWPPRETANEWETDTYYLVQDVDGYLSDVIETATFESSVSNLKSLFGLCISVALLSTGKASFMPHVGQEVLVFNVDGRSARRIHNHWLPADASQWMRLLGPSMLATNPKFCQHLVDEVGRAFRADESGERLRLAASWFFDSFSGQNELLEFVQAVVCSEILLGFDKTGADFSDLGVTELLANRCAYSIADSQQGRSQILSDFKRIYRTRSDIVHRGKHKLSRSEKEDLHRMRSLCGQVMRNELRLGSPDSSQEVT